MYHHPTCRNNYFSLPCFNTARIFVLSSGSLTVISAASISNLIFRMEETSKLLSAPPAGTSVETPYHWYLLSYHRHHYHRHRYHRHRYLVISSNHHIIIFFVISISTAIIKSHRTNMPVSIPEFSILCHTPYRSPHRSTDTAEDQSCTKQWQLQWLT